MFHAWRYRIFIEPLMRGLRDEVCTIVGDAYSCVDIGCGTGALALALGARVRRVIGIDASYENIVTAAQRNASHASHVEFQHADATELSRFNDAAFEYATLSLLLHSVPCEIALSILREAQRIAHTVIIVEFASPQPRTVTGFFSWLMEYSSEQSHFDAFCAYQTSGGLQQLLRDAHMSVSARIVRPNKTLEIVVLSPR